MKWMADIDIKGPAEKINYHHSFLLVGSCFTEHIGNRLADHKFPVLQNPNGILFDPVSVCDSLLSYINGTTYTQNDLFFLNDLWHSWRHHSAFSGMQQDAVLKRINESQSAAHSFLQHADWLIVTLGSAFTYRLSENGSNVANCHRAPGQWFDKTLIPIKEITTRLHDVVAALAAFNPKLKIIFTISPVRHLRDGVIDNNRSKARLIESVHQVVQDFENCIYFPAYELVIDVLRDYRFYDIDLAHPNYAATQFVFEKFVEHCISHETQGLMKEVQQVLTAYKHKPFEPETNAHKSFLQNALSKTVALRNKLPHLDFSPQVQYFAKGVK